MRDLGTVEFGDGLDLQAALLNEIFDGVLPHKEALTALDMRVDPSKTPRLMTSPYYPQSSGKIERWHRTLKSETIRIKSPSSLEEARSTVDRFVDHILTPEYVKPVERLFAHVLGQM